MSQSTSTSNPTTYAILRACVTQYAAVLNFTERIGRRSECIHFTYGWWRLGWVSQAEVQLWIGEV